ncbi:transcriptional regulator, BadM/Rrf2 family [Thermoclostridium stercorarium subsp. stercorarium DSM 8532]|jgi:Rrf2 family protein|uniref:Transcriptional regulator, BadM/Rrf2 family n=3 Tax=Thermoclostridium stercorarium TaxID=1510 RepID=L7VTP4_THES1|nr:Rrf2 family transcriptional regulator [Thermoclostridium stercorarium]AGC68948.1 transcriptional regulator, BadM/Rrf2 family [Thermoclostridium stercorarium subsp. stercorarium DSM 8532]AGI39931.1 transcriptional regulator [Thermoclostridium stercorarium subsp. stercorarium DSM 8532]ANW99251.1 Rrf2 family transcriptional regulator [Thermoclostridium stercorarium subsp. thermolacticum DSM 2910]ANX01879.1 Rrf2 family transcriptional regulator [Thermoclostridium stercorarium subsp. leptospartum
MRISAKGRYALAALIYMGLQYNNGEYITIINISEELGISKIYLEQVFSLLKKAELVISSKGSQGGYLLSRSPREITVLDILSAVEVSLFEQTNDTVPDKAPDIEKALKLSVFDVLDQSIIKTLSGITLADLVSEAEKHKRDDAMMFYI